MTTLRQPSALRWKVSYISGASVERHAVGRQGLEAEHVVGLVDDVEQLVGPPASRGTDPSAASVPCRTSSIIGSGSAVAAVHAADRDRAAAPYGVEGGVAARRAGRSRRSRSRLARPASAAGWPRRSPSRRPGCRAPPCPTASSTESGPRPSVRSRSASARRRRRPRSGRRSGRRRRGRSPSRSGTRSTRDDVGDPAMQGGADGELPTGPSAEHGERAALRARRRTARPARRSAGCRRGRGSVRRRARSAA